MKTTRIPSTRSSDGIDMPILGLGLYEVQGDALGDIVDTALSAGYRMFDTAPMYDNERALGDALGACAVDRDTLFVTTKISNEDQGYEKTMSAFEASVNRLGMSYVDQVLVHWPVPERGLFVDTWRALVDILDTGRARSIGVCNFDGEQIDALIRATSVVPAVNQIEVHPLLQQRAFVRHLGELGIRVQAWAPLARGELSENPIVAKLARTHGVTSAQIVLRWHVQSGTIPIPKSSRPERIAMNANVFDFELTDEQMQAMIALDIGRRTGPCSDDVR